MGDDDVDFMESGMVARAGREEATVSRYRRMGTGGDVCERGLGCDSGGVSMYGGPLVTARAPTAGSG